MLLKRTMKLSLLTMIFSIATSCQTEEKITVSTLNMRENLVNQRQLVFNTKECTLKSNFIKTENLNTTHHGLICITPEEFNKLYVKWKSNQCN